MLSHTMTGVWATCVFPCEVIGFLHSASPLAPGEQEDLVVSYNIQSMVELLLVQ